MLSEITHRRSREFPRPESVGEIVKRQPPDRGRLVDEVVDADYIMKTKMPDYERRAGWINESERDEFMRFNGFAFDAEVSGRRGDGLYSVR